VDEKAQFSRLIVRKAKLEGLLRFAVAKDHDAMCSCYIQCIDFTLSLIGQAIGCCTSIFTESFEESQRRPGAEMSIGFSGTGEMQTEPAPIQPMVPD
jgi:hypothetical protein